MQTGQGVLGAELPYLLETGRSFVLGHESPPTPPASIDWNALKQWLIDHRLVATLTPLLEGSAAPDSFKQPLGVIRHELSAQNQTLLFELLRILPPIERTGSTPIVLEGPALAYTVYPNQETRLFRDLGLLVRRERLGETCRALYERGYQNAQSLHASCYEDHTFRRILVSPSGIRVSIHWDLSRPSDYVRYDLAGVRQRCTSIEIEGLRARVPSNSDHLLLTAYQQLVCGFTEFWRVLDAALLMRAGACSEPGLAERARRQGLAAPFWVLLCLAQDLAASRIPADLEAAVRPPALVRGCLRSLSLPERALTLRASRRADVQELIYWLCCPSSGGALSEIRRYLVPGNAGFLDMGYDPERLPSLGQRSVLSIGRGLSATKIFAYQSWRLASHLLHRAAPRPD